MGSLIDGYPSFKTHTSFNRFVLDSQKQESLRELGGQLLGVGEENNLSLYMGIFLQPWSYP